MSTIHDCPHCQHDSSCASFLGTIVLVLLAVGIWVRADYRERELRQHVIALEAQQSAPGWGPFVWAPELRGDKESK